MVLGKGERRRPGATLQTDPSRVSQVNRFKASSINPVAWWALGVALAVAASALMQIASLLVLIGAIVLIILLARETAPWSQSIGFYLFSGVAVVAIRVIFRIVFNFDASTDVLLNLPALDMDLGPLGELQLFGRVSYSSLESALRDGLKMAAVILSIGLANSLANPRRLLKNTPGVLYEIATAFVIAINMAPQLIASAQRVRIARQLRGRSNRQHIISSLLIPVLEDTIDRSLALAASMDARGFGRSGALTKTQRSFARLASLGAVVSISIGAYFLLASELTGVALMLFSLAFAGLFAAVRISNLKHVKSTYRKTAWTWADIFIVVLGLVIALLGIGGILR